MAWVRSCRENSTRGFTPKENRRRTTTKKMKKMRSTGKGWIKEGGGGKEEKERLALFHCYLVECSQAPAPLAETKWLAGIWCNLHLSAKSWILFLWSRCWRAWQKAQLTGLHSWERCLWPTYRGSSSQLRATTLMENGETWYEVPLLSLPT